VPVITRENQEYEFEIHALTELTALEAAEKTGLTLPDLVKAQLAGAQLLQDEQFRVHVMETRLNDIAPLPKPFSFCGIQLLSTQIGCDGLVYPCYIVKYLPEYAIGNVTQQSLTEIFLGSDRRRQISGFDVERCPPCWRKHKNELIEYLLDPDSPHVNFL
jgi:radical SAM protein with 4Fe4S-binding SPASM domain